jgi:hypothetical protein
MDLNFSTFFWMYDEPALDIFHVKNGFAKDLGAKPLVLSNVQDFIDCFFTLSIGEVENPIVKSAFFEFSELALNPQV